MILLVHLLFGALIGEKVSNAILAIVLAFLGHYFLDIFPHVEYPIKNLRENNWKEATPDALRVALDFFLGILLISFFSKNQLITYACAFFAILPDGLSILRRLTENILLEKHSKIHEEKIHFLKNKKFPIFWRVASQVAAVIIFLILFRI